MTKLLVLLPVLLRCLKKGCARKKRIKKDDFMPTGTVEVRQFCERHHKTGDKEYPVEYYDARGKELDQKGWTEVYDLNG